MKYLTTLVLIVCTQQLLTAQIYGNGNQVEFSRSVAGITSIDIQFNADIILDFSGDEVMRIEVDENIKDLIGIDFTNGKLSLDQVKWIEPKMLPKIYIGTPQLERVYQGTHSTTKIIGVQGSTLRLEGNVGKIIASGNVELLKINTSGTDIDLEDLEIATAKINILGHAKVKLNKIDRIETTYADDKRIQLMQEPNEYLNEIPAVKDDTPVFSANPGLSYINFKIRNNSWTRKHFVVVSPKRDGNTFSYGFPMMPSTNKSEKWSVGTRIYQEKRDGERILLVTIEEKDEGRVIPLF